MQIHVDEFVVGGKEPGKHGRSLSAKKATMIVMEKIDEKTVGRVYLLQIENYEADTLKYAIKELIGDNAVITTDQYPLTNLEINCREFNHTAIQKRKEFQTTT